MNKSINRLSLQEEKGGCFQPARSEKALSGLGQAEHRAAQRADEPGVTRQPAGTARKGKRQQCACVRAGCGGKAAMSCFGARLFATATIPLESSLERWIE